jgi:4-amino-4-deoxy-L-arabinose transferase-like glycosyltransferase
VQPLTSFVKRAARWRRYLPRTPGSIALTIAIVVNLLLAGAYLWSRGGETIHLRMVAQDDHFTVYLNGRLVAQQRLEAAATGGIRLTVADTGAIPSMPTPRGIDSVKVTSLDDGSVLFQDGFSSSPQQSQAWKVVGIPHMNGGAVGAGEQGIILTAFDHNWRNYTVDVTYRNITAATVRVRAQDEQDGVDFSFRPFRHLDDSLSLVAGGRTVTSVPGPTIELPRSQPIRSMVWMVLAPYPKLLLLLLAGFAVVGALQFLPATAPVLPAGRLRAAAGWIGAGAMAAVAFAVTLFLNYSYGSHMPHVPDSVSYVFQAKILASGHLSAPAPPSQAFDFFFPPLIEVHHGRWASVYPFGHPLLLAIGVRLGAMWLVPPAVGAGCVMLMFAVGRKLYNARTGLLAALLFAGSPFFMMSAADFMSHNTAAFYLLLSIFFLVLHDRRPVLFPFLSGIFFGLLFNTRPLTAAALVLPYGAMLLSFLIPPGQRKQGLKQIAAFAAGGLLMLVAYYLYTWGATGSPFTISDTQANKNNVGFSGLHSVAAGIENEQTQLSMLALVLNDWPLYLGVSVLLLPFALGTRHKWDWFFLSCAVMTMGAYTIYYSPGIMHGPRYWYEATPFLLLLTARAADLAGTLLAAGAARLRARITRRDAPSAEWAALLVTYAFVTVLVVWGSYAWLRSDAKPWRIDLMPARAKDLRGFNGANDQFAKTVDAAQLHNALVLMQLCPNWQCYGSLFWKNSPTLDGDIVYARNVVSEHQRLFDQYPDRQVYVGDWAAHTLLPYGFTPTASATPSSVPTAPRGRDIPPAPTSTPAPTPTIDVAAAARRDAARRSDLGTIAAALESYREKHGAYPEVIGIQTLCGYPSDVGCVLREVLNPLPTDPANNQSYWYTSDRVSYIVFAEMEEPPGPSQCPEPVPEHLAQIPNPYCVRGAAAP